MRERVTGPDAAAEWASAVGVLAVPVRGSEQPLRDVLRDLVAAGSLAESDVPTLAARAAVSVE